MNRIVYLVFKLNFVAIYYYYKIWRFGALKKKDYQGFNEFVGKCCRNVAKKGRIKLTIEGLENVPKEDGFIFYPNHQGMYDVLVMYASFPRSFAFVVKEEAKNWVLLKHIIRASDSYPYDRSDPRKGIEMINSVAEQVKNGRNFIIFAEGTRSKEGNKMLNMKGGSFKAASKAKCPIVPCALVDSFKVLDEKGIKPVEVTLRYLEPIPYEEYKDMKGQDIAEEVKRRIEAAIEDILRERNA